MTMYDLILKKKKGLELTEEEMKQLKKSADALKAVIAQIDLA